MKEDKNHTPYEYLLDLYLKKKESISKNKERYFEQFSNFIIENIEKSLLDIENNKEPESRIRFEIPSHIKGFQLKEYLVVFKKFPNSSLILDIDEKHIFVCFENCNR